MNKFYRKILNDKNVLEAINLLKIIENLSSYAKIIRLTRYNYNNLYIYAIR